MPAITRWWSDPRLPAALQHRPGHCPATTTSSAAASTQPGGDDVFAIRRVDERAAEDDNELIGLLGWTAWSGPPHDVRQHRH